MTLKIFKDIPFDVKFEELYKRLQIRKKEQFSGLIKTLTEEAAKIAKPKGLYKVCYIDQKGDDFIIIDGVRLTSKVLRKNVDKINKLFIFLVSCGEELADWGAAKTDILENFIADAIQEHACRIAGEKVIEEIDNTFKLQNPSSMNPGSLGDWPIEQQNEIFSLLENGNREISVSLNESYLMQPTKSVSGIRFSSDVSFCNCQMCSREDCPTRVTDYIGHL